MIKITPSLRSFYKILSKNSFLGSFYPKLVGRTNFYLTTNYVMEEKTVLYIICNAESGSYGHKVMHVVSIC